MPLYYCTSTADVATLTTANTLTTSAPSTETSQASHTAKSTGWGVLWAQGNTAAWAAGASEPAFGDLHGFILDDTSLEGKTFAAGTWSCSAKISTSAGTVTAVAHIRVGTRNSAGVFTQIVDMAAASQGFTSTAATVTATGSGSETTLAVGDKLYTEILLDITATTSKSTTATTSLFENGGSAEAITSTSIQDLISPTLAGTSTLSATVTPYQRFTVALAGTSSLTAAVVTPSPPKTFAVALAGTSSLSATVTPYQRFTVSLAGTSTLAATVTPYQMIGVTLAGTSSLSATLTPYQRIAVTLAGTGSLSPTVTPYQFVQVSLGGQGSLTSTVTLAGGSIRTIAVILAGQGTFVVIPYQGETGSSAGGGNSLRRILRRGPRPVFIGNPPDDDEDEAVAVLQSMGML